MLASEFSRKKGAIMAWRLPELLVISFGALAILLSINVAEAQTLRLAGPPWPPFLSVEMPETGLATEIVLTGLKSAGYETSIEIKPWQRMMAQVESGKVDVLIGLWHNNDRNEAFQFSNPYYENKIHFVASNKSHFQFKSITDLHSLKIGVRQGASFGKRFDNDPLLNKISVAKTINILRMISVERLDIGVDDRLIIEHLLAQNQQLSAQLKIIEPAFKVRPLHMAVTRSRADCGEIIAKFNQALSEMTKDGRLQAIYQKYSLTPETSAVLLSPVDHSWVE